MAQILQRDLFNVSRLFIYRVRIWRWISKWISRWIWSSDFPVTPCKSTQDGFGFWIPRCGFPGSRYWIPCFVYWNLDFWFQLLVGFRIPKIRNSFSTSEFVPDSGFRIPQAKLSILTWGDSSNRHHASEVKALLCITAHCCTMQFRYRCHLCGCGRLGV